MQGGVEILLVASCYRNQDELQPEGGGHWDFRFCGFGYFLDHFFSFCVKRLWYFGFCVHCRVCEFLAF